MLLTLAAGGALIAVDRLTKAVVARCWRPGDGVRFGPWLQLRHVRHRLNPVVTKRQGVGLIVLLAGVAAVLLWLVVGTVFFVSPHARIGLVMAVAGASCNLWDRLRHHAFVDFICVGRWPAFNVADAGICVGAVVALTHLF